MSNFDKSKLELMMRMMGGNNVSEEQMQVLEKLSNRYAGSNEEEVIQELSQLNQTMAKDQAKYKKQMEALHQLRGFLNEEQKQRLEHVMKILQTTEEKE